MKLKYHIVEYVSYVSEHGYPGLGIDPNTMERVHFLSKKKAKKFIKRFMHSDPEYVRMWIAHITLQTIKINTKMVKFPKEWAKNLISKKQHGSGAYKDAPILQNDRLSEELNHLNGASTEDDSTCKCIHDDENVIRTYNEDCPDHGINYKRTEPDTFQA